MICHILSSCTTVKFSQAAAAEATLCHRPPISSAQHISTKPIGAGLCAHLVTGFCLSGFCKTLWSYIRISSISIAVLRHSYHDN